MFINSCKKAGAGGIIAYAFLLVGLGWALTDKPSVGRLDAASTAACQSLNDVHAQSNVSNSVIFSDLVSSSRRERALALQNPQDGTHRKSAASLEGQANRLTVIPLRDCHLALKDPTGYRNPTAGPIGDVATGKLNPVATKVVTASEKRLRETGAFSTAPVDTGG